MFLALHLTRTTEQRIRCMRKCQSFAKTRMSETHRHYQGMVVSLMVYTDMVRQMAIGWPWAAQAGVRQHQEKICQIMTNTSHPLRHQHRKPPAI